MIHIFDWLTSQLLALLNGFFENQRISGIGYKILGYKIFSVVRYLYKRLYIIRSNILEKQGRTDTGL